MAILKIQQLEGASAELKAEMAVFAKKAEAAQWDLYPCRFEAGGNVYARLYKQEFTKAGTVDELLSFMPATLQHLGDGVFALAPAAAKEPKTKP
jgi:hypothetical protein